MSLTFASNLTKMIDAGLGGELIAPGTSVAVGYQMTNNEVSGPIASWNDPEGGLPLKSLVVAFEPIQIGTGDPSPDNIRPISGRTAVTVVRSGKNLFDLAEYAAAGAVPYEGTVRYPDSYQGNKRAFYYLHGDPAYNSATGLIPRMDYGQLTISFYKYAANSDKVLFHYKNASAWTNASGNITTTGYKIYTSASNRMCDGVALETSQGATASFYLGALQIEIGNTMTSYESPNRQTADVQLGQTVYGGRLDVVSGVLTVEWANIASYDGETLPGEWISDRDVYAPGTTPTTGAQVCYKLAEPLTVQISPQTINSLLGQNNVWSDAGDVSVTWKDKLYTEGY